MKNKSFDKGQELEDGNKILSNVEGPNFGSSQFKGQSGFKVEAYKWYGSNLHIYLISYLIYI